MPQTQPMFEFGSGTFWGVANMLGSPVTNPTPIKLATLQDVTIDFDFDLKELYGQKQFPEAIARGKAKISGKAKFARFFAQAFNQLFFGQGVNTPMKIVSVDEGPSAIPTTPFQITVVNGATFFLDLGVLDAATQYQFTRVSAAPAAGQYSVNQATGVYTFASADNVAGRSVLISYYYAAGAGVGFDQAIVNQFMGNQPQFQAAFRLNFQNQELSLLFYNCVCKKLALQSKLDDFTVPELDFAMFVDGSGKLCDVYTTN